MKYIAGGLVFVLLFLYVNTGIGETILLEKFNGGASVGVVSGVTFSSSTAIFGSQADGIEYDKDSDDPSILLFPEQGTIEVLLRIDQVGGGRKVDQAPSQLSSFSTIYDSAGAEGRTLGDVFLVVGSQNPSPPLATPFATVSFALSTGIGFPFGDVQVSADVPLLDGKFHSLAVSYGSEGIKLFFDKLLVDSDPYTGIRNTTPVSLGDFTDMQVSDADFEFGFVGEVDTIRTSSVQSDVTLVPEPSTFALASLGILFLMYRRRKVPWQPQWRDHGE